MSQIFCVTGASPVHIPVNAYGAFNSLGVFEVKKIKQACGILTDQDFASGTWRRIQSNPPVWGSTFFGRNFEFQLGDTWTINSSQFSLNQDMIIIGINERMSDRATDIEWSEEIQCLESSL